jgi:RimJ/RimL family protein N-acetyltransferase
MTHCSSENLFPAEGLGWTPPDPLPLSFESERLVIRAYTADDVVEMQRVVSASRDHLIPWLPWCRTGHLDVESSLAEVMGWRMDFRKPMTISRIVLGVYLKETGELIGGSGIHDIRRDTASCETGYWMSPSHLRKGYTLEACQRTISWALTSQESGGMGLRRVRVYTSDQNQASSKLCEKLDITAEVHQRDDYFVEGVGLTTRLGWGVLASEWDCDRHCVMHG